MHKCLTTRRKKTAKTLIKRIKGIKRFYRLMVRNAMLDKTPRGGKKKGEKHSCHEGRDKNGDSLNRYKI